MDITTISQLISTLGFPIACTVALFYLLYKQQEQSKEDSEKWQTALNNNTSVMEKVLEKLDSEK